jgi:hypothetical protein
LPTASTLLGAFDFYYRFLQRLPLDFREGGGRPLAFSANAYGHVVAVEAAGSFQVGHGFQSS